MSLRFWGSLSIICVIALAPSTGAADQQEDERAAARDHYIKGTKAFELGAYEEAIQEYAAAYRLRDDPALLYNLGQAYRLAGHPVEAHRFYRLYLMKNPKAPNVAEVQEKIVELQRLIDQQKKTQNLPPDQVKPLSPPPQQQQQQQETTTTPQTPPPTATTPPEQPATEPTSQVAANPHPGRTKIIAGAAVAGVGVALIAGGIATGVLSKQAGDDLSRLDQMMQAFDASKESAGKLDQTLAGVFLGIGGAAVVAGGVVIALGVRERAHAHATSHAALTLPGRSHASATVEGR